MHRTLPVALLLVIANLLAVAPGAEAADYDSMAMPSLTASDSWSLQTRLVADSGDIQSTATATYAGVETVEGAGSAHRIDTRHEGQREGEVSSVWYSTSDFAKVRVVQGSPHGETVYTLPEACAEWRFPLEVGASWTTSCEFRSSNGDTFTIASSWSVARAETVTIPAGTFEAFVLEQAGETFVERWWFAPAACYWVQHESLDSEGNVQSSEALTAYTCADPQAAAGAPTGDAGAGDDAAADETASNETTTETGSDGADANGTAPEDNSMEGGSTSGEAADDGTGTGTPSDGEPGTSNEETADTPAPNLAVVLGALVGAAVLGRAKRT